MFVPGMAILRFDRVIKAIRDGTPMPQIWMTYEELAALLDCTVVDARKRVHLEHLDRKLSRDGKKRVKLSLAMIGIFIERIKTIDYATDLVVGDLRQVHALLRARGAPLSELEPRWLSAGQSG
jgi:hypothetical protein